MQAVIYRFKLKPHQEENYKKHWGIISEYFLNHCGALGSCLHKGQDNLWVAYSRWPDQKTREASWPGENTPSEKLPPEICETIKQLQDIKKANLDLEQYDDICLEVVNDKLVGK